MPFTVCLTENPGEKNKETGKNEGAKPTQIRIIADLPKLTGDSLSYHPTRFGREGWAASPEFRIGFGSGS
jgi:hypothetical protein